MTLSYLASHSASRGCASRSLVWSAILRSPRCSIHQGVEVHLQDIPANPVHLEVDKRDGTSSAAAEHVLSIALEYRVAPANSLLSGDHWDHVVSSILVSVAPCWNLLRMLAGDCSHSASCPDGLALVIGVACGLHPSFMPS